MPLTSEGGLVFGPRACGEVFTFGLVKKLAEKAFMHLQRLVDEYRGCVENGGNQRGVTTLRTEGAQMGRISPIPSRAICTKRFW